jgi:hypothetical protein
MPLIRHIAHILGAATKTVGLYVALASRIVIDFPDEMQRDLEIEKIEVDELYGDVAARNHNVEKIKRKMMGSF